MNTFRYSSRSAKNLLPIFRDANPVMKLPIAAVPPIRCLVDYSHWNNIATFLQVGNYYRFTGIDGLKPSWKRE